MEIIDSKIEKNWKNYAIQSTAAGISLAMVLGLLSYIGLVITAAVGATVFTIFAMPHHVTAQPRRVIGGQLLGTLVGILCSTLFSSPLLQGEFVISLIGGLSIGMVTLLMVSLKMEHPPAAGTALGLTIQFKPGGAIFVIIAAVIFSVLRVLLLDYLVDLT